MRLMSAFLSLRNSACNLLGNSTGDPESMRHVEMARRSERAEDFIRNISLVKAEKEAPVYPIYLIAVILPIVLFLALHRRKRGFRRKYSGFKYRKKL
jgi:hypothetical protein